MATYSLYATANYKFGAKATPERDEGTEARLGRLKAEFTKHGTRRTYVRYIS